MYVNIIDKNKKIYPPKKILAGHGGGGFLKVCIIYFLFTELCLWNTVPGTQKV